MVDWLFGDLLYWLNSILWCINLLFVCFLVFSVTYWICYGLKDR